MKNKHDAPSRLRRKYAVIVAILIAISFACGWFSRSAVVPAYPGHWDSVTLGMTPTEAKVAVPELDSLLRDIKGIDQAGMDLGDRYWNLNLFYDENEEVSGIVKKYADRRCGLFNRSLEESTF